MAIIIELFSGNGDISKAFVDKGFKAFRVDWSDKVDAELHTDISTLTVDGIISLCGGVPDIVWASPDCTTYSIASHRHRTLKEGLRPKTPYAQECDNTNTHMWSLIDQLLNMGTKYYFVENPRGRMRHMSFVNDRPRYTTAYCMWGRLDNGIPTQKPTDIWTNHPNPQLMFCDNSHKHSDWSLDVKGDYLSRGRMPESFCKHIASICYNEIKLGT